MTQRKLSALVVDDEPMALKDLERTLREFPEITQIHSFCEPCRALEWLDGNETELAFLDITMDQMDGLTLARKIKDRKPLCNIIFVTGYSQYALSAFQVHASGYLLKPVSCSDIEVELAHLSNPLPRVQSKRVRVQCFGNFEVFIDGRPLPFQREKTKELLAYLIDRRGAAVNTGELCAVLWENKPCGESVKSYLRVLLADLARTLRAADAQGLLVKRRNSFSIVPEECDCDYYRFLQGEPDAVNLYRGEYMAQYSWAEMTLGALSV